MGLTPNASVRSEGVDVLALARRFEPVLRHTQGELFLPMPVERYVEAAALFRRGRGRATSELIVPAGALDLSRLVAHGADATGGNLELHLVDQPLDRAAYRRWRKRADRPRFQGGSPFAMVGLMGRIIDATMRMSLLVRGKVPGGFAAAAHVRYQQAGEPEPTYYVRAVQEAGYIVLQYWFFYAMNDWRSTFAGVNDHEADWEQITLFLTEPAPGGDPQLAWVAFSSHDVVGDDLRRRIDDPDLELVDGTHPVVHVGAGSHSGAYLPGDYIVTVSPPALQRLARGWYRFVGVVMPWTRDREHRGIGLPFIDYRRGDGASIGPGTEHPWTARIIDDSTPWVRDFRGLWGYDTRDPLGGERAPAGPRYERNGSTRPAWDRPVAWAGLDKVPPTPAAERAALRRRAADVEVEMKAAEERLDEQIDHLRSLYASGRVLAAEGAPPTAAYLAAQAAVEARQLVMSRLQGEQQAVTRALSEPLPPDPVHAHLRHRELPNEDILRPAHWTLRLWSTISVSVLLLALAALIIVNPVSTYLWMVGVVAFVVGIEAAIQRRLLPFLAATAVTLLLVAGIWLAVTNLRGGAALALAVAAVGLLLSNFTGYLRRR